MANLWLCFFKFTVIHIYMNMSIIKSNISNENPPMHHLQDNVFLRSAPNFMKWNPQIEPKSTQLYSFYSNIIT